MVERILITSLFEETWPNDKTPVLFLGEWCRLHARKARWLKMNAEVVPYHWDDRKKYHTDFLYLEKLYEKLLADLSEKLNQVHNTKHNSRYWRILIGPWLGYFVQMLFDRWFMLEKALSEYEVSKIYVLDTSIEKVIPFDMTHFQELFVDDLWNEAIYHGILKRLSRIQIIIINKEHQSEKDHSANISRLQPSVLRDRFKTGVVKTLNRILGCFVRQSESFFISSYLPAKTAFQLQWKLGQIPKFWTRVPLSKTGTEWSVRNFTIATNVCEDAFERIAREMVSEHIPTLYLEGYKSLIEKIRALPWPQNPRFIFTANSYNFDDVFKAWAGDKTEKGSKLIITQHGGNYGTTAVSFTEDHQIAIADSFISWGWEKKNEPVVKPFANVLVIDRKQKWNNSGNLLLVTMALPRYSYHLYSLPLSSQYLGYLEDQFRFVRALPNFLQEKLLVRLFSQDLKWSLKQRWQDNLPGIELEEGIEPMPSLINNSRIFVSTYNSTTFLETLSLNIPTIIYWNPKHWELRKEAIPYFDQLKAVGIFHETPESAALKVAEVWDNVTAWWYLPEIQETRTEFCSKYSRTVKNPVKQLLNILQETQNT